VVRIVEKLECFDEMGETRTIGILNIILYNVCVQISLRTNRTNIMLIIIIIIFGNKSRRPRAVEHHNLYLLLCIVPSPFRTLVERRYTRGNLTIIFYTTTVFFHCSQWCFWTSDPNVHIKTRAHHRLLCSRW